MIIKREARQKQPCGGAVNGEVSTAVARRRTILSSFSLLFVPFLLLLLILFSPSSLLLVPIPRYFIFIFFPVIIFLLYNHMWIFCVTPFLSTFFILIYIQKSVLYHHFLFIILIFSI